MRTLTRAVALKSLFECVLDFFARLLEIALHLIQLAFVLHLFIS